MYIHACLWITSYVGCKFSYETAQALLKEYLVSGDYMEAAGCLRSLDVPHYHHEFVKRALLAAFEKADQAPALFSLLSKLTSTGQVSQV